MSPRKPTRAAQLGVTDDDYARMLAAQGGRCAIPGCSRTPKTRRFHVDHDHKTGQVRGLLCHLHNRFLPSTSADGATEGERSAARSALARLDAGAAERMAELERSVGFGWNPSQAAHDATERGSYYARDTLAGSTDE